jgi:hypothetical protein
MVDKTGQVYWAQRSAVIGSCARATEACNDISRSHRKNSAAARPKERSLTPQALIAQAAQEDVSHKKAHKSQNEFLIGRSVDSLCSSFFNLPMLPAFVTYVPFCG